MFCYADSGISPRVHLFIFPRHLRIYQLWWFVIHSEVLYSGKELIILLL